jgi:hypothetical protein
MVVVVVVVEAPGSVLVEPEAPGVPIVLLAETLIGQVVRVVRVVLQEVVPGVVAHHHRCLPRPAEMVEQEADLAAAVQPVHLVLLPVAEVAQPVLLSPGIPT